jgi:hypothetical protein
MKILGAWAFKPRLKSLGLLIFYLFKGANNIFVFEKKANNMSLAMVINVSSASPNSSHHCGCLKIEALSF